MQPDWADYFRVHANRRNLILHLVAVPVFIVSFPCFIVAAVRLEFALASMSFAAMILALFLQGAGHRLEANAPRAFAGPGDFLRRWFTEQYVTFPLFVVSGKWLRQFRGDGSPVQDES